MVKLIVFDMGGVIVHNHYMVGLMSYLGYDEKTTFPDIDPRLGDAFRDHAKGIISEDGFWTLFEDITGKVVGTWREESLFVKFFNPSLDEPTVKVAEDLKRKGCRVVCGTDVLPGHFRYHEEHHQYDVFDRVYPSLEMHLKKPDPAFFSYIAESEGVEPSEMFFTDDFPWNIESAAKLGIRTHLYRNADELRRALVDLEIL